MAHALTTGKDGSIYVSGLTEGSLDGQTNSGGQDTFITKFNPNGTRQWTKLMGTSWGDMANAMTTGADGSIYVSGVTGGNLDGHTNSGGDDAFISKFDLDGTKQWTKLLGTNSEDVARAMTTGNDGSIYISGNTYGSLDGQTNSGNSDAFITKFDPDGTKVWTKLIGSNSEDYARAITTGADGSIYVSGNTYGSFDGQINSGVPDIFITKLNPDGTKSWTKFLGTSGDDQAYALTNGVDGSIYVAGYTRQNLDGQANSGGFSDAFVNKLSPDGTKQWTKLLG
jgi:hypothetical protein